MNYKSKRWEHLRERILRRDGYMCQLALRDGRHIEANTVHHVFPADLYPQYQYCEWNLISLSPEAHNAMHDRDSGALSDLGERLRRELAVKRGLEGTRTVLVIGNPGAGKTTYVKQRLGNGIVYDLDAIAGALRLKQSKTEEFKPARWMANALLPGFTEAAHKYVDLVYVIRTAPTIEELETLRPTKLVVLYGNYGNAELTEKRRHKIARRIIECVEYAKDTGIELEEINTDKFLK